MHFHRRIFELGNSVYGFTFFKEFYSTKMQLFYTIPLFPNLIIFVSFVAPIFRHFVIVYAEKHVH